MSENDSATSSDRAIWKEMLVENRDFVYIFAGLVVDTILLIPFPIFSITAASNCFYKMIKEDMFPPSVLVVPDKATALECMNEYEGRITKERYQDHDVYHAPNGFRGDPSLVYLRIREAGEFMP